LVQASGRGNLGTGSPLASTAIEKLAATSFAGRKAALAKDFGPYPNFEELTKAQNLPGKNSPELREFGTLLQNPWFTRAWGFQEVVVSELVGMRCRQCTITYPEFYRTCPSIDYSKDVNDVYIEVAMHLLTYTDPHFLVKSLTYSITHQRKGVYQHSSFDLLSLAYGLNERSGLPS
jgi:hypothetical protein